MGVYWKDFVVDAVPSDVVDVYHCLSLDFVQLFDEAAAPNVLRISHVQQVRRFQVGPRNRSFCEPLLELLGTVRVMQLVIGPLAAASL